MKNYMQLGVIAINIGLFPTGIGAPMIVLVVVLMLDTVLSAALVT